MKRLLLPLIAALALPTAVNANYFPDLEVQPQDYLEWFHIGNVTGNGGMLCTQFVAGDLILERAVYYRDGILRRYKKEGERAEKVSIAGFNRGIEAMQSLSMKNNRQELKGLFDKCEQLKIN
tara:strand:- start:418 stop:783 length:366 start_codon:yes stop_codon:yes gene_type:complete